MPSTFPGPHVLPPFIPLSSLHFFHLFDVFLFPSFFRHPGSSCLLPLHTKSSLLYCRLFPTTIQYQKISWMSACICRSLVRAFPHSSERYLYMLHTLQSSLIILPAIHSSSWSSSSFCSMLWLFLLPENVLVLIFLGKETISISYPTSWIPFHHKMSLSFIFGLSFSSVLADPKFLPFFLPFRGSGITSFILNVYLSLLCVTNPTSNIDNQLTTNSSQSMDLLRDSSF